MFGSLHKKNPRSRSPERMYGQEHGRRNGKHPVGMYRSSDSRARRRTSRRHVCTSGQALGIGCTDVGQAVCRTPVVRTRELSRGIEKTACLDKRRSARVGASRDRKSLYRNGFRCTETIALFSAACVRSRDEFRTNFRDSRKLVKNPLTFAYRLRILGV